MIAIKFIVSLITIIIVAATGVLKNYLTKKFALHVCSNDLEFYARFLVKQSTILLAFSHAIIFE